jgi:hypothetical protein
MNRPVALALSGNTFPVLQIAFLVVLALGAGTALPAAASVEGFHYTREVQVPAPGWVRVPLDLAAIQHLAPGASDLRVFSPAGGEVPLRIEPAVPRVERRPVTLSRAERADDGWELTVDLGADPPPHERLFLQPLRPPLAPPDRIENSPDGSAWQPLAAGEPPVPETPEAEGDSDSEWIAISYPASGDRYLRLHWPRQTQPPRVAAAEVESVTGPTLSVTTGNPDCDTSQPGTAFCTLALPAAGQIVRRLTVEVQGGGRIGYRLAAPRDSRWQDLAEGVWQRVEAPARHLIAGGPDPVADTLLRLELYGSPQSPPRIASWGVELTVQTVLFRAEEAGRYVLAYGGPATGTRRAEPPPFADIEAAWLEAGAEAEHSPAPLPAAVTAPAVRLESRRLTVSWQVVAPSAKPGFLVRLELPDAVYRAARTDLGNLRLVSGERQIPFYRWSPAAPALVARLWDLDPAGTGRRSRESEVEIRLPEAGLALTELDLTAPARPLRRTVGVRYQEPAGVPRRENGKRRDRPAAGRQTWKCQPQPPLPCLERLALPGHAPQVLAVRFQDGDNPPLTDLDVALWRRRDVLLFVWPEAEEAAPVRLLVGPENLRTPSYDLTALGDSLLSYPWQPAELSLEGTATPSEPRWARWVMPMTLLIAGVCLILLLGRILSEA